MDMQFLSFSLHLLLVKFQSRAVFQEFGDFTLIGYFTKAPCFKYADCSNARVPISVKLCCFGGHGE